MNAMPRRFSQGIVDQKKTGILPVIPDIKVRSPGEGILLGGRPAEDYAAVLHTAGARVFSVVTESERYGGSPRLLARVAALGLPVLRKDFLTTRGDIRDSLGMGASAVLLISSLYEDERRLAALYEYALELGLEPFVETHSEAELSIAKKLRAALVGINNRDIAVLEQDGGTVTTTETLCRCVPENALLVSESGILTAQDARRAAKAGADAILVGTALLRAQDPAALYRALSEEPRRDYETALGGSLW